tara:strand:- start:372 stop:1028 length:657 start_codon:yes stop_codon:yes gene_type:complete
MTSKHQVNTREAILAFLLRKGVGSASNLAIYLGISVQAMRKHLRSLEFDGFVVSSSASVGPGRPSNLWQLTVNGKNLFNKGIGSEKFALELMDSMEDCFSEETISYLLSNQACQKADLYKKLIGKGNLNLRLQKLVELRNAEGYMSEIHPLKEGSSSWILNGFHCAINNIAEKYPVVCELELELIRSIFEDCEVMRIQWRIESGHSCGFQITPNKACA